MFNKVQYTDLPELKDDVETIIAVAILADSDNTYHIMPPPHRHSDIIKKLADKGIPRPIVGKQGFITSQWRFVDRFDALDIALKAGQVMSGKDCGVLFSNDIW